MKINKDDLKQSLTIDQIFDYVAELGGEPIMMQDYFISRTICHGGESHKLYYYDNSHLFHCYTECEEGSFDIYQLTQKIKSREEKQEWPLPKAILYVADYFGYIRNFDSFEDNVKLEDWDVFKKYQERDSLNNKKIIELKKYDETILFHLPQVHISPWELEGISFQVIKDYNIRYNPANHSIIIPHYDINNNLIGIRERTLIKEMEQYGKYRPAVLNGVMYNHPLGFNLYNINHSKDNILKIKKVFVGEGEKFTMMYASLFGEKNDISVACCGSNLISYQVELLLSLGVEEIIIAFDKQFQTLGDKEFKRWIKKLEMIHKKYSHLVNISFMFDKFNLLQYKSSPIDEGKEKFIELFERRIVLK